MLRQTISVVVAFSVSTAAHAQRTFSVESSAKDVQREHLDGSTFDGIAANCQLLDDTVDRFVVPSDLSAWAGSATRADDFIPFGTTINTVSVWGTYLDGSDPEGDGIFYCVDAVTDQFTVTVYADLNGRPGAFVGRSTVAPSNLVRGVRPNSGYEQFFGPSGGGVLHSYQLTPDVPITNITPGERHWLEVVNNTDPDGFFNNSCVWFWAVVETGGVNKYSYWGTVDSVGNPLYSVGGMRSDDLAFCLDMSISVPVDVERACCQCPGDGGTCAVSSFDVCRSSFSAWDSEAISCPGAGCSGGVAGDDCLTGAIPITGQVSINFDNTCATTDGPRLAENQTTATFEQRDLWYAYTADCTGTMTASMCGSDFDSVIAIYHDYQNPTECVCPVDASTQALPASDEGCTGIAAGGSGWTESIVFTGECWLIRVGGFTAGRGVGNLDVSCEGPRCVPLPAPVTELLSNEAGTLVPNAKNRSLSFIAASDSIPSAYRVTFVDLPSPYDAWNGTRMWVTAPKQVSELSGGIPIFAPTVTISRLACQPLYMDWSAVGAVHIVHEGIVPGGRYYVQRAEELPHTVPGGCFSEPLEIINARWGDMVGRYNNADMFWFAADGSVDVTFDVVAALQKFANLPGAPSKVRVDLVPANLDFAINIADIVAVINAFGGKPYPVGPSGPMPCQ